MSIVNLPLPSNLTSELASVEIVNLIDILPVNPHHSWAQLAGTRSPNDLTTQAIHHDGISKASVAHRGDIELATIIANNHIRSKSNEAEGDPGFPYHVWIRNGIVYLCNDLTVKTYGVSSNNGYTVHISVSGNYKDYDVLTDADRNALYVAILAVKQALPDCTVIRGHNEFDDTKCPGFMMEAVRRDVETIEQRIKFEQSDAAYSEAAYQVANQILYMYGMAKGKNADGTAANSGQVAWAKRELFDLRPYMQSRKLL